MGLHDIDGSFEALRRVDQWFQWPFFRPCAWKIISKPCPALAETLNTAFWASGSVVSVLLHS